jgi:hypothetical protein
MIPVFAKRTFTSLAAVVPEAKSKDTPQALIYQASLAVS